MNLRIAPTLRLAPLARAVFLVLSLGTASLAHAGLFDDNEARQAILDLRADVKQLRDSQTAQMNDQNSNLQRGILNLQNQIDQLKQRNAELTGRIEELERRSNNNGAAAGATGAAGTAGTAPADGSNANANNSNTAAPANATNSTTANATGDAAGQLITVRLDGQDIQVSPEEKRQYDACLNLFQAGNFAGAERNLNRLASQHTGSAYTPWLHYWIGNSQYAQKRYAAAIESFKRVIATAPNNPKSPEAALSIANSQGEMGKASEAKRTLENLIKAYPNSEAADIAREKLRKSGRA